MRRMKVEALLTRFGYNITNIARAIFTIFEVDFRFAWTFYRDSQRSGTGFAGPYVELAGLTLFASFETRATGVDTMSTTIS